MVTRPDFFIVGAPKCGTTALHTYLGQHPRIFTPKRKELHHFASDLLTADDPWRSREKYLQVFQDAEDGTLVGESSVFYLFSRHAARRIHDFNPDAKIVVMLRNPVDMLYSYHSQLLYNGDEEITSFRQALDAEKDRKAGASLPKHKVRFVERFYYRDVARFSEQLERYFDVFGRQQVMVILYDDFKEDTLRVYRNALEFLGVDSTFAANFEVVNANKRVRSVVLQRYLKSPPRLARRVGFILPGAIEANLRNALGRLNVREAERTPMDAALRITLQEDFREEVMRLSSLLGRDLTSWSGPDASVANSSVSMTAAG
jgi:hypothetical protein